MAKLLILTGKHQGKRLTLPDRDVVVGRSEECNITLTGEPEFVGIFHNAFATKRDHIVLYVCRDFTQSGPKVPDMEIAEAGFFPVDALPQGTVDSARARIRDVIEGREPPESWQAP